MTVVSVSTVTKKLHERLVLIQSRLSFISFFAFMADRTIEGTRLANNEDILARTKILKFADKVRIVRFHLSSQLILHYKLTTLPIGLYHE